MRPWNLQGNEARGSGQSPAATARRPTKELMGGHAWWGIDAASACVKGPAQAFTRRAQAKETPPGRWQGRGNERRCAPCEPRCSSTVACRLVPRSGSSFQSTAGMGSVLEGLERLYAGMQIKGAESAQSIRRGAWRSAYLACRAPRCNTAWRGALTARSPLESASPQH